MVAKATKYVGPLGICDHCGTIGRIWYYGKPDYGQEAEICYQCIEAIISALR